MLQLTLRPYKYILIVLVVMLIILALTPMPAAKATNTSSDGVEEEKPSLGETFRYLVKNARFRKAVAAQFVYVGMQTTVWSFTIRLALKMGDHLTDSAASTFMIYSYIAWFVGKVVANFLMGRFSITRVLAIYSVFGTIALILTMSIPNMTSVIMAIAASFFFGPQWPTIYSHALDTVTEKKYNETAGAFVVMAIVGGGAIVPAIQGWVSDITGSMQFSFIVPMLCFLYVTIYWALEYRYDKKHPYTVVED